MLGTMKCFTLFVALFVVGASLTDAAKEDLIYGYECQDNICVKLELDHINFKSAISLPVCRLFCGNSLGTLWPKPSGEVRIGSEIVHIDPEAISFDFTWYGLMEPLYDTSKERFMKSLHAQIPDQEVLKLGGYKLKIVVEVMLPKLPWQGPPRLTLTTKESYHLKISSSKEGEVTAVIETDSFFGARHGMESLAQLIVYDDIRRELQMPANVEFDDKPAYPWRALLLDTSRNFYSVKSIKRTLDGMAMVKLNTFHWHITDAQSFPMEIKSHPDLYKLGAYSPRKVYTHKDIREVVEYGYNRGIRVMPEFDAPAHAGEGWHDKNLTACFKMQPWAEICVEPPCGQLDPTVDALYPILEDLYREMFELFKPDVFHMGGDEVSTTCWNTSTQIRDWMTKKGWNHGDADYMRLWGHFQTEALKRVDAVSAEKVPIILWTSHLTDEPYLDEYLNPQRYIIQIWTKGDDAAIAKILKRGYRVIFSNYDALYLDCGGAGWVTDGNNWCSPYIGWQKVYSNNPRELAGEHGDQVLGAEGAIWSEQVDEYNLDARFWPRASALAERLWSSPTTTWQEAEARMLNHRQRLVEHGLYAEALQPEWCMQNQGECPIVQAKN